MKLRNPLKSLTWHSLFRNSGRRLRRRSPNFSPFSLAADVLEDRQLLSGTVNVVQVGNSLTLTADANGSGGSTPTFFLHRINSTTVEVDNNGSGTLIAKNGAFGSAGAVQTFSISSVSSVTVNLGTGYDTFHMFDLSTTGSVTVNGKSFFGGAFGADVEIFSNTTDMTIGGSIVENLGLQTGTRQSEYDIDAAGGHSLTVNGNIFITDSHSGVGSEEGEADSDIEIYSNEDSRLNNLLVKGAITVNQSGTGNGDSFVTIQSENGNTTVNGPVTVFQSGSADMSFQITSEVSSTGNVSLASPRASVAASSLVVNGSVAYFGSGTGSQTVKIETGGDLNGFISGGDSSSSSSSSSSGTPSTLSSSITLTGSVTVNMSGTGDHTTNIDADEDGGPILIKGSVLEINSGTGLSSFKIESDSWNASPITINGSVTVLDLGTGHSEFAIETDGSTQGEINNSENSPILIGGNVTYNNALNTKNHDDVTITGSTDEEESGSPIVTIKGSLSLSLSNDTSTAKDSNGSTSNFVFLGEDEGTIGSGYGLIVGGLTTIFGGGGEDQITMAEGQFKLGAIINTGSNPSAGGFGDFLEIDGSQFGGAVLVSTWGPNAAIEINNGGGFQTTEFMGAFLVTMLGSTPSITIADGTGPGFSPVKFDSNVFVTGIFGGGGIFEFNPANVTFFNPGFNPLLIGFTKVLS